ncbi:MAG: PTS IIA-like nitrogen-regulatory protein PtsN [Gammaproteobacteria bacterium]|nr:MAG: PTS IIA-like nitrogen-regulatory protein PtsN [Pseudomonadota bacterium]PIE38199.1 MAG: PTS IIA-like nitrogen-regulatory protein PtsN [Gammaproteobacteria bacterium]
MTENHITIQSILSPELTIVGVPGSSKKRILEKISSYIAEQYVELDENTIFNSLLGRERLGSTGIGQGIAIPHCRLQDSDKVIGALLILDEKVPFDAIDNEPVDILFVLVVPKEATSQHLELLGQVAEKFNQTDFCKKLRACKNNKELYNTVMDS